MNERLCIKSILDTDLYQLSMGNIILDLYPNAIASYRFKNRGKQRFNAEFINELKWQIAKMSELALTDDEYKWIKETIPYLKRCYIEYLKNYRFNPNEVTVQLTDDNNLEIEINGNWLSAILWETALLATISELYFKVVDKNWSMNDQDTKAASKLGQAAANGIKFSEFGTRRRRSFETQKIVIDTFTELNKVSSINSYLGTSNVYFSYLKNTKPMGTIAHQIIQAMQALESVNHCNYYAMEAWTRVYGGDLGIMLSDTVTVRHFLKDFNSKFANLFKGTRWDSGNAYEYTDLLVNHYKKLGIDPLTKVIVFSDNLNVDKSIEIKKYCEGKIQCAFGIGTYFSNDFLGSPAMNMVIKLHFINGFPCVKLSDVAGKETGDVKAIEYMKWIIGNS
jgi:nicotinate phosphoribosyltransferase